MNRTTLPKNGLLQVIREQRAIVRSARQARRRDMKMSWDPKRDILAGDFADIEIRTLAHMVDMVDRIDGRIADEHPNLAQQAKQLALPSISLVPNDRLNADARTVFLPLNVDLSGTWAEIEARLREQGFIPEGETMVRIGPISRPEGQSNAVTVTSLTPNAPVTTGFSVTGLGEDQGTQVMDDKAVKLAAKRERDARIKRERRAAAKVEGQKTV